MAHRILRATAVLVAALTASFVLVIAKALPALANEPIQEGAPLDDFVEASKPEWNFPRANSNDPCWPDEAIYADGSLNPGVDPHNWPDSDSGCHGVSHAVDLPFPTYYSAKECNDSQIQVSYTIYQALDAFKPSGHKHDFEHIDVIWKRNGDQWTRDRLLMSRHGGHGSALWDQAESWNADFSNAGLGFEHPRIFVGFGSHAMFNNQAGAKDVISAYTFDEYRHADYPARDYSLVEVTEDNDLGKQFWAAEDYFGSADSHPAKVARDLCSY